MLDPRFSENEVSGRDIPSFIEPRPPLILNPFMRPRPQKGTNLLELFEEDSECEESELVQVYLRLKPCNTTTNLYEVRSERCLITSLDTTTAGHGRRTQHNVSKMYTFSHIFKPESSQREIFEHVVKDNLKKLPEGRSFTLLTYGASGSGKTFTLMGTVASPGLVPRSLEYVFNIVEASQKPVYKPSETGPDVLTKAEQEYELQWVKRLRQVSAPLREKYRRMSASLHSTLTQSSVDLSNRTKHYVWVSFIEIYNEGIYDLLVPCDRRAASKLAIREDSSGNVYVKGATQAFVRSGEEAYDVMVAGKHNLQVAATGVHAQSSRSHCVFTITMLTEIEGEVRSACVRLCDLAGCERAARTRNTGARMQESRAINSSLHVLERCLHTLRRRQAGRRALVPYRESKLTRLLGAGLSGARGEAVSMVVTLNPAPEYAHETRHVLQLAAVARDIQVNNTLSEYPSTLETTQDTTVGPGAEVMKLRADNELLRFELARTEAWYKEQLARVEQQHSPAAPVDMWALVEEAKQITKEYYEDLICTLRKEKNEMVEEHENEVNQLLMNITVLEEKLSGEKLARARAEEEVVHLRACIEERDEKSNDNKNIIAVIDSDNSDGEDDPFNESLEPTFKKEDINRSRLTRQSLNFEDNSESEESADVSNESAFEKSRDTLKDPESDNDSAVDSTYATYGTETSDGVNNADKDNSETVFEKAEAVLNKSQTMQEDDTNEVNNIDNMKSPSTFTRTTYFVTKENSLYESSAEVNDANNISHNVPVNNISDVKESIVKEEIHDSFKVPDKPSTFVNSIINSLRKQTENNNSLDQFERLEKEANEYDDTKHSVNLGFENIKILKEKRHFFNDGDNQSRVEDHSTESNEHIDNKKSFFDHVQSVKVEKPGPLKNEIDDFVAPPIVRAECLEDIEPQKTKQLLGESDIRPVEPIASAKKSCFKKKHDSLDVFDSPQIHDKYDDQLPSIDDIRRSIAKVNLSNKNNQHKNLNDSPNSVDKLKHSETSKDNFGKSAASDQNVQLSSSDSDGMNVKELLENANDTGIGDSIKLSESKKDFEVTNVKEDNTLEQFENIYKDITAPRSTDFDLLISQNETQINEVNNEQENEDDIKYNLRNKSKTEKIRKTKTNCTEPPKRRNLRLRRKKNLLDDDSMELDKDEKLKDIANLQTEFSDITMDVPARKKNIQDIPSPEKEEKQEENIPPMLGIQSCPSKLSTRGRRKLFTPRVEPLEESIASAEADERIRVPRPSYHRPKARRKL